jgi:hypothetical protein
MQESPPAKCGIAAETRPQFAAGSAYAGASARDAQRKPVIAAKSLEESQKWTVLFCEFL